MQSTCILPSSRLLNRGERDESGAVMASVAKQSMMRQAKVDCVVAPILAMTERSSLTAMAVPRPLCMVTMSFALFHLSVTLAPVPADDFRGFLLRLRRSLRRHDRDRLHWRLAGYVVEFVGLRQRVLSDVGFNHGVREVGLLIGRRRNANPDNRQGAYEGKENKRKPH